MSKGYLANGLFTLGDRIVNKAIALKLRENDKGLDLYVPQENEEINDKNLFANSVAIAEADTQMLMDSDFLVAVIDGVEIDSGVAAEIGAFSTTGKPIYALYTDVRQDGRTNPDKLKALIEDGTENQFAYRNLFVIGLIKKTAGGVYSNIDLLAQAVLKEKK